MVYLILIIGHPSWSKYSYKPTGIFRHITKTVYDFTNDCASNKIVGGNEDLLNSIDGTVSDLQWDIRDIKTSVENIESNF